MKIRPLTIHDRKDILRLLRQRKTFNEKEIQVALEVIDEALSRPEKGDYHAFCACNGHGSLAGYIIQKGARRIYVDTSSTPLYEPARSFYEKHGYHVACLLKDFYREGDHKMIFMKEV